MMPHFCLSDRDEGSREITAYEARPPHGGKTGRRRMIRLSCLLVALTVLQAHADAPQPPPADHLVRSPNGRCAARAAVAAAQVTISGRAPNSKAVSWTVPGWHRVLLVGDSCRLLGVGYPGQNLLALGDREAATPMMTFHHDGGPVRVVRLGELYRDLATLPRTVSHWSWQRGSEWDGSRWTVHTVDGRVLAFTP